MDVVSQYIPIQLSVDWEYCDYVHTCFQRLRRPWPMGRLMRVYIQDIFRTDPAYRAYIQDIPNDSRMYPGYRYPGLCIQDIPTCLAPNGATRLRQG